MAQGQKHTGCKEVGVGGGSAAQIPFSQTSLSLAPLPREVLGLVDLVALENGELGPLLSPGTLRGLEDECVTDVKVLGVWERRHSAGREWSCWAWGPPLSPFRYSHSLFPSVGTSELGPKDTEMSAHTDHSVLGSVLLPKHPARQRDHQ